MKNKNNYDVKKAGGRLLWRLSPDEKGNISSFKPNENDLQALKVVLGWITSMKKETLLNQRLFAKLYIYNFTEHMRKYESTVLEKEVQKDLSRILAMPLNVFYDAFYKDLSTRQFEEIIKDTLNIGGKELIKDDLKGIYDEDFVNKTLEHQITEAINRFGNLD